jgi:hypothetical protein
LDISYVILKMLNATTPGNRETELDGQANENIITVIDLGSAKTLTLAAETTKAGLRYRGHGILPLAGTKCGVIVGLESAARSVSDAGCDREQASGFRWNRPWSASAARTFDSQQSWNDCAGLTPARTDQRRRTGRRRPGARIRGSRKQAQNVSTFVSTYKCVIMREVA